ncbi:Hypothetical predicted protein [Paramuricea clavata]|uniref:Uncharacterized protein n=1 Tax=Paramuricea clavata TaxID=317549 RepID=A0A7D9IBE8_PARCT|nr:Hypothetical predicted protein [Paramuricea clavata]
MTPFCLVVSGGSQAKDNDDALLDVVLMFNGGPLGAKRNFDKLVLWKRIKIRKNIQAGESSGAVVLNTNAKVFEVGGFLGAYTARDPKFLEKTGTVKGKYGAKSDDRASDGKHKEARKCYRCNMIGHIGRDKSCPAINKTCKSVDWWIILRFVTKAPKKPSNGNAKMELNIK